MIKVSFGETSVGFLSVLCVFTLFPLKAASATEDILLMQSGSMACFYSSTVYNLMQTLSKLFILHSQLFCRVFCQRANDCNFIKERKSKL